MREAFVTGATGKAGREEAGSEIGEGLGRRTTNKVGKERP